MQQRVEVVLHQGLSQELQLRAYLHASHLAFTLNQVRSAARGQHSYGQQYPQQSRQVVTQCTRML